MVSGNLEQEGKEVGRISILSGLGKLHIKSKICQRGERANPAP